MSMTSTKATYRIIAGGQASLKRVAWAYGCAKESARRCVWCERTIARSASVPDWGSR